MKEGVPLPNGDRVNIAFIPLGPRKTVFAKDEVERVWQALQAAGAEMGSGAIDGEVIVFPGKHAGAREDDARTCSECRRPTPAAASRTLPRSLGGRRDAATQRTTRPRGQIALTLRCEQQEDDDRRNHDDTTA